MKKRIAAAFAAPFLLLAIAAAADNYPVRDGAGALMTRAAKLIGGVFYDVPLMFGLNNGNPVPVNLDSSGNIGVNIQSQPSQAAAGSNAAFALAVQGTSNMLPVQVSGGSPSWAASGLTPVTGTLTATGQSAALPPINGRPVNLAFSVTGAAAIQLERKFVGDASWYPLADAAGQKYAWTTSGTQTVTLSNNTYVEGEAGVTLRWNVTSCVSCSVSYRISQ